jgi:dTDP-4-dehydrorhamnose 3,5-epimerase
MMQNSRSEFPGFKTEMNGVLITPLRKLVNERGHLMEVQRHDDVHYPGFGQAYITCTLPDVIKAWYRHQDQVDQIAPVSGMAKTVLYDSRVDSLSYGKILEVFLDEREPVLLRIPPGIWHGHRALGEKPAYLLHLNTIPYQFDNVDEERLGSDSSEIPYQW